MGKVAPSTHDALLDAAEELFARRGYSAVSVREIADAASANIAAVSYHFGSKAELYLHTVQRAMQRRESASAWRMLETTPQTRGEAIAMLAHFICEFTDRVLDGEPSPACRLIMHEAAGPSAAIDSVVNDYLRPQEQMLMQTLRAIISNASDEQLLFTAHSVLGQILHYVMLRPVIERLSLGSIAATETHHQIGRHIARFSLAALGCTASEIDEAWASPTHSREVASS